LVDQNEEEEEISIRYIRTHKYVHNKRYLAQSVKENQDILVAEKIGAANNNSKIYISETNGRRFFWYVEEMQSIKISIIELNKSNTG
jgi:hypothetical protein